MRLLRAMASEMHVENCVSAESARSRALPHTLTQRSAVAGNGGYCWRAWVYWEAQAFLDGGPIAVDAEDRAGVAEAAVRAARRTGGTRKARSMSTLEAAVAYAACGWAVFPLHPIRHGRCGSRQAV